MEKVVLIILLLYRQAIIIDCTQNVLEEKSISWKFTSEHDGAVIGSLLIKGWAFRNEAVIILSNDGKAIARKMYPSFGLDYSFPLQ